MERTKPDALFGRSDEWSDLASFADDGALGATLAVLYGRRRQGKTLMLELLVEQTGGVLLTGLEQSSAQNLDASSRVYADAASLAVPVAFTSWEQVVDALMALGEREKPLTVVIDELPYLLKTAPEIPSIIQRALSPRGRARQRSRTRLVLCGSAFSVMGTLLGGSAALRGRATREILLHPFAYREAAEYWGVADDPELAVRLDALVGGTPAYRDVAERDEPRSLGDLDDWVVRKLLNPSTAFFREGRVLLAEEPELSNLALYFSVLAAIASGRTRRGQIADALGRKENALAHALSVLEDTRLVVRSQDALRSNRSTFHISEPMLRFHQLVVAPNEPHLVRRLGERVWAEVADTVAAQIYGPHLEELARQWVSQHASGETLGGEPGFVGTTVVSCPEHRAQHEVDVVAVERLAGAPDRILLIGEAKWHDKAVGIDQLERLRHVRHLLGERAREARLALFGTSGFTSAVVVDTANSGDIELVDLERLYHGS